ADVGGVALDAVVLERAPDAGVRARQRVLGGDRRGRRAGARREAEVQAQRACARRRSLEKRPPSERAKWRDAALLAILAFGAAHVVAALLSVPAWARFAGCPGQWPTCERLFARPHASLGGNPEAPLKDH